MPDFTMSITFTFFPNTIIASAQMNTNLLNDIRDKFNAMINGMTGHTHTGTVGDGPKLMASSFDLSEDYFFTGKFDFPSMAPLGSIIPFYDFNNLLTFDNTKWAYCNGGNQTIDGIGLQTLPDLSARYLVGFGTEGGGDIGTAPFATPPVGNAGNTINLQHSHTVNAHDHSLAAHTHDAGSLHARIILNPQPGPGTDNGFMQRVAVPSWTSTFPYSFDGQAEASTDTFDEATVVAGTTAASAGNTGNSSPGTNNQLSTTQDIQPRSIRVRFIMRIST